MKGLKWTTLVMIVAVMASCKAQKMEKKELTTEEEKVSYSLGASVARYYKEQGMNNIDMVAFNMAVSDVFGPDSVQISEKDANEILRTYFTGLKEKQGEAKKKEGEEFLLANAKKEGIKTTESGLQYEILKEGTGEMPKLTDKVKTHYHGTLIDGTVFDSSVQRGEPISFPVNGVIKGWTEALQLMKVGAKWKLYIPYDLAYGERGAGAQIPPYSALIFEVELLDIEKE